MIILICAAVMAFSLYKLLTITGNYNQARDEYEALRQYVTENDEFGYEAQSGTGGNEYYDESEEDASNGGRNATSGRNGSGSRVHAAVYRLRQEIWINEKDNCRTDFHTHLSPSGDAVRICKVPRTEGTGRTDH